MAGTIKAGQFVQMARRREQELNAARAEAERLITLNLAQAEKLSEARQKVLDELTALILPELVKTGLDTVNVLTGFRGFIVNDPIAAFHKRRDELSSRIVAIESDPRYVNRERLTDEAAGDLTLVRAEILKKRQVISPSLERFTAQEGFQSLAERGYGTPNYRESWISLQYYRDWQRGDEIEEALAPATLPGLKPKLTPFAELAAQYRRLQAADAEYAHDLAQADAKIKEVTDLVVERENAVTTLPNLAHIILQESRQALRDHIEYLDREELGQRVVHTPDTLTAVKKLHGIEKQIYYLEELRINFLTAETSALDTYIGKIRRKADKYLRPKNSQARISSTEADNWLKDPRPKLKTRRTQYEQGFQRVHNFNNYNSYQYGSNGLWWDIVMDGTLDGDFIPEVANYRRQYPRGTQRRPNTVLDQQGLSPNRRDNFLDIS